MNRVKLMGWAATAAILLIAGPKAAPAQEIRTELEAQLNATPADPLASGKAKFERRIRGGVLDRVRLSVEVEDVATADVVLIRITRNGQLIGADRLALEDGFGDLNLDSRDGDMVPVLRSGDVVTVRDAADGTLLLRGALRRKS